MTNIDTFLARASRDKNFVALTEAVETTAGACGRHINVTGLSPTQKSYIVAALTDHFSNRQDAATNSQAVKQKAGQVRGWTAERGEETSRNLGAAMCLIEPDELQIRETQAALQPLLPDLQILRPREINLINADAGSRRQEQDRLLTLAGLLTGRVRHVLISATALLQRLPDPDFLRRHLLILQGTERIQPETLEHFLLAAGYEKVSQAEAFGQFSRRGDIVDVVPPDLRQSKPDCGLRISFFDDEIDSFTYYSLISQRSVGNCRKSVLISPVKEVLLDVDRLDAGSCADSLADSNINAENLAAKIDAAGKREILSLKENNASAKVTAELNKSLAADIAKLTEGLTTAPADKWLSLIYPEDTMFWDYWQETPGPKLPVVLDEPLRLTKALDTAQAAWQERIKEGFLKGQNFLTAGLAQYTRLDCMRRLDKEMNVITLAVIGGANGFPAIAEFVIRGRESDSYCGKDAKLTADLKDPSFPPCTLCAVGEVRRQKLADLLRTEGVTTEQAKIIDLPLPRGFVYPAADMWVLGEQEIFAGKAKRRRNRGSTTGVALDLFSDLRPGDLVVHDIHGIGIYKGLRSVEVDGVRRDYIWLSYANNDELYLPMEALDQLQKYIGVSEQQNPKLSRLGGTDWQKLKNKARDSVKKLAFDLVKLYAERRKIKGYKFPPETTWEREFAESFPFEETDDQLRCIKEVSADMESDKVMDRLLCGDVGFGKTEVAFRALFKAVMGGKQAALLAPTTVLAQQHYENFMNRINGFPIRVGLLSRFANDAMQHKTLSGLATGNIDVVIGTHRLLSKDVKFKKLGLLIIDEEQRFGVEHKEKLKVNYQGVDVLTLSATPIPRTLHMALSGIRDISVIEEAPLDRRSVLTYVMEYDPAIVIDAINREFSRHGQVFYLYNNTAGIDAKVNELQEALPGARIAAGHGKMSEKQLEQVINDFYAGETDILVCTTIIESGIDMPNVNTLIVENADRLGLAQLYQLRGRVGRSGRQAYAYITYRRDKVLTEVAEKRLTAIRDFTELGSGFKIAMKDLEVRGAGNILGGEQHGQMAAVGYDMYCRMLDEEIAKAETELNGEAGSKPKNSLPAVETIVDIPVDAYLPREFIADEGQRMDMYKRLTAIESDRDYHDVIDELLDRFGELPPEVTVLAAISYIRHMASKAGIERVSRQADRIIMRLPAGQKVNMPLIAAIMAQQSYSGEMNFAAGAKPYIEYRIGALKPAEAVEKLRKLFMNAEKAFNDQK